MDLRTNIAGKHVLIVEDIVDTGNTLEYLLDILLPRKPATLKTCVLLRKRECLEKDVKIDYLGFDIPDLWVVGYGLDYADRHRALPYIGVVENEGKGISRCTTRIGKRTGGRGRKHSRISWKGASRNRPGGNREKG
jgi:hypoxanthine phosphoribosyltransferase